MICPFSDSEETTLLRVLSSQKIASRWKNEYNVEVEQTFKSIGIIEHWRCEKSGFEWYSPEGAAGSEQLYIQLERLPWYYMPEKWEFKEALKYFQSEQKLLEIGSGVGHFLNAAKIIGIQASGIESNPVAADRSRKRGCNIFEEKIEDLAICLGPIFDGVCAFQVIEHIALPSKFIKSMLNLLRPNGKLVLSVPNASILQKIDKKYHSLLNQPPHHMSHWNEHVFRSMENFFPIKLVDVRREPLQPYHIKWFSIGYLRGFLPRGLGRVMINSITTIPIQWLLYLGFRKALPGHTLLGVFEKKEE